MNKQPTLKYGIPPNDVEKNSFESEEYKLDDDFTRLKMIEKAAKRSKRYDQNIDKRRKEKLRSPQEKGELVYVLSGTLKKKTHWRYFTRVPPIKNLLSTNTRSLQSRVDL